MTDGTLDTPGPGGTSADVTTDHGRRAAPGRAGGPPGTTREPGAGRAVSADRAVRGERAVSGDRAMDGGAAGLPGDRGPDAGRLRTGDHESSSLRCSQEVTSLTDEPERPGRSLVTTSPEVIRRWAEERNAVPATVRGTEHGDHLGVLRFDFGGHPERLEPVSWDEWFHAFTVRGLNFVYQEERQDGHRSNFFRLTNPGAAED
jgi:hypothetical protein